jgi:hypothetical protein
MSPSVTTLLILLAPWGLYFLIKRVVFLAFEGFFSILRSGKKLDSRLRAKFDAAYEANNADEIMRVEEDAMYAKLQALSKPRVSQETRKLYLNYVIEWCARNNYPGNRRQIDLLVAAMKANQRHPDLISRLSTHLHEVSNSYNQLGPRKSSAFKQITNTNGFLRATPGNVSAWLTIILYGTFIFLFNLMDQLSPIAQLFFWVVMIFVVYIALGRLLIKSISVKIILAIIAAVVYSVFYSYWHHLKVSTERFSLPATGAVIEYPGWLGLGYKDAECGKRLSIDGGKNIPPLRIVHDPAELEVFDENCSLVSLMTGGPREDNRQIVYYVQAKDMHAILNKRDVTMQVKWSDPKTGRESTMNLRVRVENLLWYYGRQGWTVIIAGAILALLTDFIMTRLRAK